MTGAGAANYVHISNATNSAWVLEEWRRQQYALRRRLFETAIDSNLKQLTTVEPFSNSWALTMHAIVNLHLSLHDLDREFGIVPVPPPPPVPVHTPEKGPCMVDKCMGFGPMYELLTDGALNPRFTKGSRRAICAVHATRDRLMLATGVPRWRKL